MLWIWLGLGTGVISLLLLVIAVGLFFSEYRFYGFLCYLLSVVCTSTAIFFVPLGPLVQQGSCESWKALLVFPWAIGPVTVGVGDTTNTIWCIVLCAAGIGAIIYIIIALSSVSSIWEVLAAPFYFIPAYYISLLFLVILISIAGSLGTQLAVIKTSATLAFSTTARENFLERSIKHAVENAELSKDLRFGNEQTKILRKHGVREPSELTKNRLIHALRNRFYVERSKSTAQRMFSMMISGDPSEPPLSAQLDNEVKFVTTLGIDEEAYRKKVESLLMEEVKESASQALIPIFRDLSAFLIEPKYACIRDGLHDRLSIWRSRADIPDIQYYLTDIMPVEFLHTAEFQNEIKVSLDKAIQEALLLYSTQKIKSYEEVQKRLCDQWSGIPIDGTVSIDASEYIIRKMEQIVL